MTRLGLILARVLASATLAACGGSIVDVDTTGTPEGPSTGGSSTSSPPSRPHPPKADSGVAVDAGPDAAVDAAVDAGCAPVLVRSDEACAAVWYHPCGIPAGVDPSDGMSMEECKAVCSPGGKWWGCDPYLLDDLPGPSFSCYACVEGRRPEGYVEPATSATVAGWLAHAADLERVSIDAFRTMARELAHHGAPEDVLRDVARAEADEVRHTRIIGTLARREGAMLSTEPVPHGPVRPLVEVAVENAVEGCIRETYGALVAAWQAKHAARADIRKAMAAIAPDETAHADLAWRAHAWLMGRLTPAERARVDVAMAKAVRELTVAASIPVPPALVSALGLPAAIDARRLVEGLDAHLWTQAA
jgi:hypothetical protein